jgi:hypothetical protein
MGSVGDAWIGQTFDLPVIGGPWWQKSISINAHMGQLEAARMTYVGSLLDEPVSGLSCGFEINFVSPPEALLLVTLRR